MPISPTRTVVIMAASLAATALPARAEGRDEFVSCQAMVARVAQVATPGAAAAQPDNASLARCRQVIRDWTLRESRMSVDEHGRPLR